MRFELLDSLSLPSSPDKPNEDSFAVTDRMAAAIDGATGLGERLMPGLSDAQWLAQFSARRLRAHAQDETNPGECLRRAASDVEKSFMALRRRAPNANYEIPYASLMMAGLDRGALTLLWFGDCVCLIRAPDGRIEMRGEAMTKRAQERIRARELGGIRGAAASGLREEYLPALRISRNRVNTEGSEWLFAPSAACADHALSATAPIEAGSLLLLATDGFFALTADYERYTLETLFEATTSRGLSELGRELREIEAGDPDGLRFARFKRSDDATALLLSVTAADEKQA